MKIFVRSRQWVKKQLAIDTKWRFKKSIISIFSSESYSPFPDSPNILKLQFDDVAEEYEEYVKGQKDYQFILFNLEMANKIKEFIKDVSKENDMFIHCDAGISRSGAVGYILNEYFNKFLENNENDYLNFSLNNPHILPNTLVIRIMKRVLYGEDFTNTFK